MTQNNTWPKEAKFYFHRDKDSNYELADKLGLSEEAAKQMRWAGSEVAVTVLVHEDGRVLATHFGSLPLTSPLEI